MRQTLGRQDRCFGVRSSSIPACYPDNDPYNREKGYVLENIGRLRVGYWCELWIIRVVFGFYEQWRNVYRGGCVCL